jgi:hypothetical protein
MAFVGRAPRMVGLPLCILGCWLERLCNVEGLVGGKGFVVDSCLLLLKKMCPSSEEVVIIFACIGFS